MAWRDVPATIAEIHAALERRQLEEGPDAPPIYLLFAGVLFGGLWKDKPLLARVLDAAFDLDDEGWRKLTLRWALFFVGLAALNELVWRTQSTQFWVAFKVFGFVPLTLVFGALQYPLLTRHANTPPG